MASRHVFTQRLKSGVIFSAPGNLLAMPEGGWGDDTPIARQKKPKRKIQGRGLDHFSHWVAKVAPGDEPYDNIDSFRSGKDTGGIGNEYRPYSISRYPETEVETGATKIPEVALCLPILNVSLTATVDGTVAHTELVQKFHNPSDVIINAAKHVFPLYDGAVITSFECTIGDERRVRGVVKPKVQARKEFEEAVRDKVAAPALLEEHTPEIFETSLGNIPPNTIVEIKITYVQELKVVMMESEATEGIALTIPMSIAPRYSKAPIEWEPASKLPEERLDIWIRVLDNGKVNHEGCEEESGHLLQFEGSKPAEYSSLSEKDAAPRTYYVWHHVSEPAVLRKDFVFVVQMNEGNHIKSRAIACPADDNGFATMMVNIRANDLFRNAIIPQSFTGEILFLLDQSGSMGWTNASPDYGRRSTGARKIDVMREAMLLALSGIPSTCVFNVISWGSATMGLCESSRAHTKENIREAKSYVSQVEADMGGTDLLRALESVVKRRVQDRGSTQIIILTDGELEPEDSIQFIWKKRQLFGDSIRFFALGIGDEVSHRLVESIAECGGGYSDVVHTTQTPRWHDRLNRLLKSALEPNSWSCDIDLGSGFERKSLVDYKLEQEITAESDKTPYIQAPFPISSLHPFSFTSISFLVDLRHGRELPRTVTISTTTAGAKKKTYELAIETSSGNDGTIHRLVAKSVLLDLQDEIKRGTAEIQIAKTNAESIGTTYSISSRWTSFVAISEDQRTETVEEQKMSHYKALLDEIDIDNLLNHVSNDESSSSGFSEPHFVRSRFDLSHFTRTGIRPGGDPSIFDVSGPEEQQESDDNGPVVGSCSHAVSNCSSEVPGQRPWEVQDSGEARARANSAADSARIPTRELFYCDRSSSVSAFGDSPLVPNDSSYQEVERLERTETENPDDSMSNLTHPLARQVATAAANSSGAESYDQAVSASQASQLSYPRLRPMGNRRPQLPEDVIYAGNSNDDTARRANGLEPSYMGSEPAFMLGSPCAPFYFSGSCEYPEGNSMSHGTAESPSFPPNVYGPLDWQFAMNCQDGQGLFDLDEKRPSLHLHFCPETVTKFGLRISELLSKSSTPEGERDDISARILDTLMMMECYKTHRAKDEDTWDLMMERAWDAVISVLGLADEEESLEQLAAQLRGAMMHAHYVAATGVKDSEKDESSVETMICPACDAAWLKSRRFFCPFDHEPDDVDEFSSWEDFWKHQVSQGHVVCPQEVV